MHDRHIPPAEATKVGLNVSLIEEDKDRDLQDLVMSVHHASINYIRQCNYARSISNIKGLGLFVNAKKSQA